jgi:hypothetical protein
MPTERRRYMVLREMQGANSKGQYVSAPKRHRQVLLVINPTAAAIAGMIAIALPSTVNLKVEDYREQFPLREDRR